jgi:site-specific DNA-methyltransferase (adenine-specific)
MESIMLECKRVLKSGGHAVVWALPRTSHWTTMAIENAGFEIRDVIHHIFNTGFPKSLNIGKALDKKLGLENGLRKETKGTSEWEGFGTALKPACEHWILARKPLEEKTIVEQVLKNGCGGIDIDGCRIPLKDNEDISIERGKPMEHQTYRKPREDGTVFKNSGFKSENNTTADANQQGRFPANVIVQDDALNDGTISKSKRNFMKAGKKDTVCYGDYGFIETERGHNDSGSKSRYFDIDLWAERNGILQIPKPSKSEKNKGCEELEEKKPACVTDFRPTAGTNPEKWQHLDNYPQMRTTPMKNNHPTVKSITLMSWLIKLVSKENDIVLDPFLGSGTTAVACINLKRNFIGIELSEEYCKIAEARVEKAKEELRK